VKKGNNKDWKKKWKEKQWAVYVGSKRDRGKRPGDREGGGSRKKSHVDGKSTPSTRSWKKKKKKMDESQRRHRNVNQRKVRSSQSRN